MSKPRQLKEGIDLAASHASAVRFARNDDDNESSDILQVTIEGSQILSQSTSGGVRFANKEENETYSVDRKENSNLHVNGGNRAKSGSNIDLNASRNSAVRFRLKEDNETFMIAPNEPAKPVSSPEPAPLYPSSLLVPGYDPSQPSPLPSASPSIADNSALLKEADKEGSETESLHSPMPLEKASKELGRSTGTGSSFTNSHPNAMEVSETFKTKFFAMRWSIIALISNALLLWLVIALQKGFMVPLDPSTATILGCVVIELILIFSNSITNVALDHGAAAYFGHRLASRGGYSLAVCGYMQTSAIIEKMYFPSYLSLNSTCRQLLSRVSSAWMLLHALLILTPLAATSTHAYSARENDGTLPCVVFHDDGLITDRLFPNVTVEMGLAEMVFGTALGTPRSEFDVPETLFLVTPQIVGACADGDTVVGPGYSINISTSCVCAPSSDATGLGIAGVPTAQIPALLAGMNQLGGAMGMANYINFTNSANRSQQNLAVTTALTGTFVCGGYDYMNPDIPICTTNIYDFRHKNVMVSYMTDGTPASIAPKAATITSITNQEAIEYGSIFNGYPAVDAYGNLANVRTAVTAVLDAVNSSSAFVLPPTVPAMVNPLLYWLTPNLMNVDPTLLEAGIETTFAIFLRAGVQRTFTTKGQQCIHNIEVSGMALLQLADYGVKVALAFVLIQLAISVACILAFVPWFQSPNPIGPAIRLMSDSVYFTTLLHASTLYNPDTLCNAQPYVIWQAMDIVVRVGETFRSRDEDLVGHISIDRPKYIAALTNGRRYN